MERNTVKLEEVLSENEVIEICKSDIFKLEPYQIQLTNDFKAYKHNHVGTSKTLVALDRLMGHRCNREDDYARLEIYLTKLKDKITLNRFKDNWGKEINIQPTYEEYCNYVFKLSVFDNYNGVLRGLHHISKHYVTTVLNSNIVKRDKIKNLLSKAYEIEFDEKPQRADIMDLEALAWEELKKCREHDDAYMLRLNKCIKIFNSYLDLLNLKMANKAGEDFYNRIKYNCGVFHSYHKDLKLIENSLNTEGKLSVQIAKENYYAKTGNSWEALDNEMLQWLNLQEVIKEGPGNNILFITLLGSGTFNVGNISVTCVELSMYDALKLNNIYSFNEFDKIIKHTVGTGLI